MIYYNLGFDSFLDVIYQKQMVVDFVRLLLRLILLQDDYVIY